MTLEGFLKKLLENEERGKYDKDSDECWKLDPNVDPIEEIKSLVGLKCFNAVEKLSKKLKIKFSDHGCRREHFERSGVSFDSLEKSILNNKVYGPYFGVHERYGNRFCIQQRNNKGDQEGWEIWGSKDLI